MARDDWFRNHDWNPAIEAAFFEKLRRARDIAQRLRIQAHTLAPTHPEVSLRLLDAYFALGDNFDHAQAHVNRASAHLTLGDTERAIEAYEMALAVEERRPNPKTQACLALPFLIASSGITSRYARALHLLEQHQSQLMFPVDHFRWHAAQALILLEQGQASLAHRHAQLALEAAALDHSGFRYHPNVGLVGDRYDDIRQRLAVA